LGGKADKPNSHAYAKGGKERIHNCIKRRSRPCHLDIKKQSGKGKFSISEEKKKGLASCTAQKEGVNSDGKRGSIRHPNGWGGKKFHIPKGKSD